MKIKVKILFIVVPLLTAAIVLVSISSYMLAASSVTRLAVEFLNFKADQVRNYADGQWNLLVDNGVSDNQSMREAAMTALESFSRGILRSETETIFAVDTSGKAAMQAGPAFPLEAELPALAAAYAENRREFTTIKVQGIDRVAYTFSFVPFSWQIFVTEERGVFYGSVEQIFRNSLYILAGCLLVGILLLLMMTGYLTGPIETLVRAMQDIIRSNNLDQEVPVMYQDEIGELSHTFNLMLRELAGAYEQIKRYAFDAVVAQKREMKIRNVFQLYVPKDVIEEVFINPEKMLVGNNRNVSILFSDIRSFTTISERMAPDELVNSLNRYFSIMVDVIMERNGVVDKYIGDAIMAMFGAPVSHDNDALSSVIAGLEMIAVLDDFNRNQIEMGAPEFKIGVGVNYGIVTVGNIGCEKKMNYTVIGDTVNLASRLEGLTKMYKEPILFAESVFNEVSAILPCRMVDRVAVKGKTLGVPIYTARLELTDTERTAWKYHNDGTVLYYRRQFGEAAAYFKKALSLTPGDTAPLRYLERCVKYQASPPAADWDGVEIMTEK